MAKKKPLIENTTVAPEAAVVHEEPVAASKFGIELKDTALASIDGKLVVVNHATGLNLRKSPHYMGDIVEVLPDDAVVVRLALPYDAEVAGWALVHTGQHTGWVDLRYILNLEG